MKNILFSTIALCAFALFTQTSHAQTATDEQAIKDLFTNAINAYYAGDATKATSHFAEKAVYVSHTGQIFSGKEAIHKSFEEEIKAQKPTPESFKFNVSSIRFLNANIALVLADLSGVAEMGGQKIEWTGVSSFTVSRSGSQWLIELEQDTPVMPPQGNH
jgi:uncharacterized protein (TIGR02246 family)